MVYKSAASARQVIIKILSNFSTIFIKTQGLCSQRIPYDFAIFHLKGLTVLHISRYSNIFFDLDGTLSNPKQGITRSVQYALTSFGFESDTEALTKFIGPPLRESFSKFYGFSVEDSERAVAKYREYFAERGIFENEVYLGIPEMLERLATAGKMPVLATSKPQIYAKRILEHFGLAQYFVFVAGCELDGTRDAKAEVIAYALRNLSLAPENAIMVGDRKHDILGANAHTMDSVGVLYGFGDRAELEKAGAPHIVETVKELEKLLLAL